jgi:uncharacterized protein (TIGR02646 family)
VKHIQKRGRPPKFGQWCTSVAGTNKEDFREIPRAEKDALLNALIAEQGGLCAYTMRRIEEGSSHVEHIKPQSLCRAEHRGVDLDYGNLVACFPRDGMSRRCRYGAQEKGDWWESDGASFVSPLHPACEQSFHFDLDGNITPVGNHQDAVVTIEVLALDHASLTEDRKRVIVEFIYGPDGDSPLSPAQANQAAAAICAPYTGGHFREFCVAIRDALAEYLTFLARLARKRKAARRRR